jgi:hypothetical protein
MATTEKAVAGAGLATTRAAYIDEARANGQCFPIQFVSILLNRRD